MSSTGLAFEAKATAFLEPKGGQIGSAQVTYGELVINKVEIRVGQNGPFVSMPRQKGNDGNYRDVVFPTTKEGRENLNAIVMDAYNADIQQKLAKFAGLSERAAVRDVREERPSATAKLDAAKKEVAAASKVTPEKSAPQVGDGTR